MWGFFESQDYLQEKILAKNISDNIEHNILTDKLTIEQKEKKIIILKCIKSYYGL
jgi:hypothetical protein